MNEQQMTWDAAKEYCSNLNLTMFVPDTRARTVNIGFAVNSWPPPNWQDAPADSFDTYWLGYREIDGQWVIKLKPVETQNSKFNYL